MKLLAPKTLAEFTFDEFYEYVRSLHKPRELVSTKKEQKELKVRVKRKKDGTLSIVTKRSPLYVTEKEIEKISAERKIPQSELFLVLKERGYLITKDHREAQRINETVELIPW